MKKYDDDQAGNLAVLIAYYGFQSLFPLMLALVLLGATHMDTHVRAEREGQSYLLC